MDVGGWLRSIGLDRYERKFRDNRIDADVLAGLTVDDLRDLGVTAVGDRRRLLAAIAALATPTPRPDASALRRSPALHEKPVELKAERRPITVMFCDLAGSTSLAARMDAEDWRDLVGAYLDASSEAVTAFGGHVLKRLGDGLMALFGYPRAHENDAERAVRAALAIQRALADFNARGRTGVPELLARVGVESGSVVIDAAGEVFGDAPNTAARVQAAAEPGTVLVTATVQRQTAGLFVVEEKGAHDLRGLPGPLALYRVVRTSGGGRRRGARIATPLVGREDELALLDQRWSLTRQGVGQFVQIVGEPGIGKSRLVEAFRERLSETPHTWVEWNASQLLQNTPLHPIAEWGRQRFGGQEAHAGRRLADLESALVEVKLDPAEHVPLLAPLVDIPLPPERASALAPEELRRRQLTAMTAWYLAGARTQPVVLAVEDLHWADPTSFDLVHALAERCAEAPLLVLATARPEFRPAWGMRPHHGVVALAPLDRAQVRRMAGEIASQRPLSDDMLDRLVERAGGVPLFVEELTRLLVERGDEGGAQAIPSTLQQSLAARLDRLGDAREAAQIGAVLGREFSYPLLLGVAGTDEPALNEALRRLTEADILFVEGIVPEATYRFKHALIQDAAYDSLLRSRRRTLHRRAAERLRDDPEHSNATPEAIAHHFAEAGLDDAAIEWWGKAGDQALRRSAFQEAIAHLGKAIALADKAGGGTAGMSGEQRQLQVAYGNALFAARGPGAPETAQAFAKAREFAVGHNAALERLSADYGMWVGSYIRGELSAMKDHATAFLADVRARPDSPESGVAHRVAGITHWFAGEYREAQGHLEQALTLFKPGRDDDLAFRFGHDAGVAAMLCLALTLWPLGDVARAVSLLGEAEARSAGLAHIATRAHEKQHAALFELMRGDLSRVMPNALELARLVREHDLPHWRAYGVLFEALASAGSGSTSGALDEVRRGAELLRDRNAQSFDGLIKIALSEAEAGTGGVDRALAILDEALATCERTDSRAFEAELHRARGEMLLKRGTANATAAEEAFRTAVAVARRQSTRSFELRAALALARLYQSTARAVEARAILAPAIEGFSATSEWPEIAEAQALLAELAETDEVRAAAASRQRRLKLETSLGQAMMYSQGYASGEAETAFARVRALAAGVGDAGARFDAHYGLFIGSMLRGELGSARKTAESFLRDAEDERRTTEAVVAHRSLGFAHLAHGDLTAAEANLGESLRRFIPERDRDAKFRFGADIGVSAAGHLALANWTMGDVERARALSNEALGRAVESAHAPTQATAYDLVSLHHMLSGDAQAVRRIAKDLVGLSREHGMPLYLAFGDVHLNWALAWLDDRKSGISGLKEAMAVYLGQGNRIYAPLYQGLLAELEAEGDDADGALSRTDEALALADETGEHWTDALLHRIRGIILLKREPASPALGEAALLAAIAVAQGQRARSFELQAALPLAKLYQSTARLAEGHAVLNDALQGFTPTPLFPPIAEAQALLQSLA